MRREDYLGHSSQFSGVEEHRLVGGKGDGMRLLEIRNGLGMEVTISLDRCADISRLYLDGKIWDIFHRADMYIRLITRKQILVF